MTALIARHHDLIAILAIIIIAAVTADAIGRL